MALSIPGRNVYIDFGQRYAKQEKDALARMGIPYDEINISGGQMIGENIYIPDRNLTMASICATLYNPDKILMAGLKDDNCIDKTRVEFELMTALISRYAGKKIAIESPYWELTKGEIVHLFKDKQILKDTFSCYSPLKDGTPCGNCPACLRRTIALETNGINSGVLLKDSIIREYLGKIHTYDKDRISRFFFYLQIHGGVRAIDIDGVLCEESGKFEDRAKIASIKRDARYKWTVLYTSRLDIDREITEKWLRENEIKYDALITHKLPYNLLYDDRATNKYNYVLYQ